MHSICCLCFSKRDLISFCSDESQIHQNYMMMLIEVVVGVKFTPAMLQCICVYCSVEAYNFYVFREKSQVRAKQIQEIAKTYGPSTNSECDYEPLEDVDLPSVEELKLDFVPWIKSKLPSKSNSTEVITTNETQVPRENGPVPNPNPLNSDKNTKTHTVTTNNQQIQCPETEYKRIQCDPISSKEKRIQCSPITDNKRVQCRLIISNSDKEIQCDIVTMEDKQTITPITTNRNIQTDRTGITSTSGTQVGCDLILTEDKQVECKLITREQSTNCCNCTATSKKFHKQTQFETIVSNNICVKCSTKTDNKSTQCDTPTTDKQVQCDIPSRSLAKRNKLETTESKRTRSTGSTVDKQVECNIPISMLIMEDKQTQCNDEIKPQVTLMRDIDVQVDMEIDYPQLSKDELEDMKEDTSTDNVGEVQLDSVDVQNVTKEKVITCGVCKLKFVGYSYYKHRKTHLICPKCNKRCKNFKKFNHHINTVCDDKMKLTPVVNITRLTMNGLKRSLSPKSQVPRKLFRTME